MERLQLAYINAYAGEAAEHPTSSITIDQIMTANQDLISDGFVYEKPTGQKSYEITNIKVNDANIGETVTVPNNGSVTLKVEVTETSSGSSKYYGIIEEKYYEIKLEDEQIVLDDEAKTLQEVQSGEVSETPTLSATWDNKTGDNSNVNNLSLSVEVENSKKDVIITDSGAEAGTRTVKISYGTNVTRSVKINIQGYTLSYNANGGSGEMTSQEGTNLTVVANGFAAPAGKSFTGWNTSSDGTGTPYAVGATVNTNVTLYAIWQDVTYVITYYKNDGTETTSTQNKVGNNSVTLKGAEAFSRDGYEITKWNTQADGNGTDYTLGATYSANSNLTLYAVWEETASLIEFSINGDTYFAESGMNWYEWCQSSEYSRGDFECTSLTSGVYSTSEYDPDQTFEMFEPKGGKVKGNATIKENGVYDCLF